MDWLTLFLSQAWPLFVVAAAVLLYRRHRRKVPDWGEIPDGVSLTREPDGAIAVPVRQIEHRRNIGYTSNGISPKLWITDEGLRFKVFKLDERRFTDFRQVDAMKAPFLGTRVIFTGEGIRLHVILRDRGVARALLRWLGFRVAKLAGHARVHGIDVEVPPFQAQLWGTLSKEPTFENKVTQLIASESARLEAAHRTMTLKQILAASNTPAEDRRNKGFYMLLNPVAAESRLFHGADAAANWWHRNLRMYALIQAHAQPGERVLVIAGSGHTAILRDLLRADAERVEEDVQPYL